jgi:hypothetical protein
MAEIWGIAAAAIGGAVVSGVASNLAAGTEASAANNAQQIQANEFNTITGQESPYMQSGYGAQQQLNYLLGIGSPGATVNGVPLSASASSAGSYGSLVQPFNTSDWQSLSPSYGFQLQQGEQGVLNQDSGSQGAESGAALKDLISYNQNTANTSFNNAFQMYQTQQGNIYNRLAGISQLGQNAAANTGQQGTTLAGNEGSAAVAAGNAIGTGISNAGNSVANAGTQYAYLSALQGNNSGINDPNSGAFSSSTGTTSGMGYDQLYGS